MSLLADIESLKLKVQEEREAVRLLSAQVEWAQSVIEANKNLRTEVDALEAKIQYQNKTADDQITSRLLEAKLWELKKDLESLK